MSRGNNCLAVRSKPEMALSSGHSQLVFTGCVEIGLCLIILVLLQSGLVIVAHKMVVYPVLEIYIYIYRRWFDLLGICSSQ